MRQLLLLFILISLVGAVASSALRQSARNDYHAATVSPDGNWLAAVGSQGLDIYDLNRGTLVPGDHWRGAYLSSFAIDTSGRTVQFLDNDRVVYMKSDMTVGLQRDLAIYSLEDGESKSMGVEVPNVLAAVMGLQGVFRNASIYLDPATQDVTLVPHETSDERPEHTVNIDVTSLNTVTELSPNNQWLAFVADDTEAGIPERLLGSSTPIFDTTTGLQVGQLNRVYHSCRFSPDSQLLLCRTATNLELYSIKKSDKPFLPPERDYLSELEGIKDVLEYSSNLPNDDPMTAPATESQAIETIADETEGDENQSERFAPASAEMSPMAAQKTKPSPYSLEFTKVWSRPGTVGYDGILQFSDDGTQILVSNKQDSSVTRILNVETGAVIREYPKIENAKLVVLSADAQQIIGVPRHSDARLRIWDANNGRLLKQIGGTARFWPGVIYGALFVVWTMLWGWFSKTSRASLSFAGRSNGLASPGAATEVDFDIEVVEDSGQPPKTMVLVWRLMIAGGIFAIVWSLVPLFYFQNGLIGNMIPFLVVVRYVLALFGIIVGVMAASRGFGQSVNWIQTTALLQTINLINLDVVNMFLGIASIAMINHSCLGYLKLRKNQSNATPDTGLAAKTSQDLDVSASSSS